MIKIYTDGATSNNGYNEAVGGWAFVVVNENEQVVYTAAKPLIENVLPTNNRCELMAILSACKWAENTTDPVWVYSDSAYCINCYKDQWWVRWQQNGWKTSNKTPVVNRDLWEKLIVYFKNPKYKFIKVKGHQTNEFNNLADKLAVEARSHG